mmetsp:Transcript_40091/g.85530  ORF Transcript_40091/g.85530 Transcript_40091/m.85530 type:complete len:245 (+) Transcript_40091:305-1039(+)
MPVASLGLTGMCGSTDVDILDLQVVDAPEFERRHLAHRETPEDLDIANVGIVAPARLFHSLGEAAIFHGVGPELGEGRGVILRLIQALVELHATQALRLFRARQVVRPCARLTLHLRGTPGRMLCVQLVGLHGQNRVGLQRVALAAPRLHRHGFVRVGKSRFCYRHSRRPIRQAVRRPNLGARASRSFAAISLLRPRGHRSERRMIFDAGSVRLCHHSEPSHPFSVLEGVPALRSRRRKFVFAI